MRLLKYILLLLIPILLQAEEWNMITIRNLYVKASESKENAEKFKSAVEGIQNPNQCIKGYIAAANMIEAKYAFSPYTKLSLFNKGKGLLETAIKNDPNHIELRFLRLGIQTNAPSFLGYSSQIQTDKSFILSKYVLQTDLDLKNRIKSFMLQPGICTEQEKKTFN